MQPATNEYNLLCLLSLRRNIRGGHPAGRLKVGQPRHKKVADFPAIDDLVQIERLCGGSLQPDDALSFGQRSRTIRTTPSFQPTLSHTKPLLVQNLRNPPPLQHAPPDEAMAW